MSATIVNLLTEQCFMFNQYFVKLVNGPQPTLSGRGPFYYLDDTVQSQYRAGFNLQLTDTHTNRPLWPFREGRDSVTMRPGSTLCLTICWVILAVWVPIGSAELRRLSVALSHSPIGSRASWNWRAKTCSSSNCLCLRDGRQRGKGRQRHQEMRRSRAFIDILLLSQICVQLGPDFVS